MICYQCGSTLGSGKYCLRCGADVSVYRRIVRRSNGFYNVGLEKARVRDLSGAAEALSRALELDKRNTQARNLLGLVLYELGEAAEALIQWKLSRQIQPDNNPAVRLLEKAEGDAGALGDMSQGIEKYNQALEYALHDSEDLAIIQLQRVIKLHPKMVKAHSLLALLELWEGRSDKAEKECKTVLKIDRGNTFCKNLSREIAEEKRAGRTRTRERGLELARMDAEIKDVSDEPREKDWFSGPAGLWLRLGIGVAAVVAAFLLIIQPTIRRRRADAVNQAAAAFALQTQDLTQEIRLLEEHIRDLNDEIAKREKTIADRELTIAERDRIIEEKGEIEAQIAKYEILLNMFRLDPVRDREVLLAMYHSLTKDRLDTEGYEAVYEYWTRALGMDETQPAEETLPEEAG
ncbi:MAG: tetratricopeptide repeat protein [Lachnospiraceae bacterium]|nr:tetratricopeptide repeat protein [Lachnospiraceae bacterium]